MPQQDTVFRNLLPRIVFSVLFKYYWFAKADERRLLLPEGDFYHRTCYDPRKLGDVINSVQSLCRRFLTVNHRQGQVEITCSNPGAFTAYIESYVQWVASQNSPKLDPSDIKSKVQIRIIPFSDQKSKLFKLLSYLVREEFKSTSFFLREVDLNEFKCGDCEKFCLEELIIWMHLRGELTVKGFVGTKDRDVNGKNQYFWILDIEFHNELHHGPFVINFERKTISFRNQPAFYYARIKKRTLYAWGVVFELLIRARGQSVKARIMEQELRNNDIDLTVYRAVLELRRTLRQKGIPASHFPQGSPGRGSRGYRLLASLREHPPRRS